MFSLRASSKNIRLLCDRAVDVPCFIETDSPKLRQVLTNLIDNAVKFTEQGQVVMRVRIQDQNATTSESYLCFEVADTGLGIAPHELNLIFESFMQAEAGRQSQQGTGLGLAICRRFVQLMGGELKVSSQLGKGSVFSFALPLKVAEAPTEAAIAPTQSQSGLTEYLSHVPSLLHEWNLPLGNTEDNHVVDKPSLTTNFSESHTSPLDASSFQIMSARWIAEINFAARSADAKTIFRLLEQIPEKYTDLREAIASLVHHFKLEHLIQLTQQD
ncbi:MAG: hypothetical protein HC772_19325 [Leptolyngbyaceae cyanobacterium CRU_2_3]|nr:hypothetical protein [Leptolyngbyaceae cyanobacterium CRU_2_3]